MALLLASPVVSSARVNAAPTPIEDNELCLDTSAGYWELRGFYQPTYGITSTWEDGGESGSITFTTTVPRAALMYASREIAFFADSACEGVGDNADSNAPTGFKMCLAATAGALSDSYMEFVTFPLAGGEENLTFEPPIFGTEYDLGAVPGDGWVPNQINIGAFELNDGFEEVTIQVSFGPGPECELLDSSEQSLRIDIDLDHYLNRIAAESGTLPNTL